MAHRIQEVTPPAAPLRVLPRGLALVQDYRALKETGTNRFHGWKWDATLGPPVRHPVTGIATGQRHGGRVKQPDAVVEIPGDDPCYAEYVAHLKNGDLWAADPETAAAVGVPFEPHFLGEHPATSEKHGCDVAAALKDLGVPSQYSAKLPFDTGFKPQVVAPDDKAPKPTAVAK